MNEPIFRLMIEAKDPDKHDICFSRIAGGYMFEGKGDLIKVYSKLSEAIAAMEQATALWTGQWVISENPYGGD